MGGGAGMRSATKLAGIGMGGAASRLGGILPASMEHSVTQRAGQAIRSAVVTTSSVPLSGSPEVAAMEMTTWEPDDWELAEFESVDPPPRLVFGPAPSLEETESATRDLKFALEKRSLFPYNTSEFAVPFGTPDRSSLSSSDHPDVKDCVTYDPMSPFMTTSIAHNAFKLLHESPAAQSVVASIASDPNVWEAVLQNPELQNYMDSYYRIANAKTEESIGDTVCLKQEEVENSSNISAEESVSGKPETHGNAITDVLEIIKDAVVDMANTAFGHIKNIFGFSAKDNGSLSSDSCASPSPAQSAITTSFMGLAVMVIMVVIFKRF